jgi:hypothetical protein
VLSSSRSAAPFGEAAAGGPALARHERADAKTGVVERILAATAAAGEEIR